ncbi:MAG: patatin-like phospholipase family protein [Bacteroidales bacterium]
MNKKTYPMKKPYKLGLVLGGGGARGFAHLGVTRALYEHDIKPDIISGVSAGSIVGAFLAAGLNPAEVFELLRDQDIMKITNIHLPKDGLLKLGGLQKQLKLHIPFKKVEELPIKLIVAVCNLNKARVEYLSEGPLADLVLASSSIPVLFAPVSLNDQLYADGGVLDNLPVKPVRKICEKVIAVDISPVHETDKLENLFQIAVRTFHLSVWKYTVQWGKKADILIEPPDVDKYDILSTKHVEELYERSYQYTLDLIRKSSVFHNFGAD